MADRSERVGAAHRHRNTVKMKTTSRLAAFAVVLALIASSAFAVNYKCMSDTCQIGFWNGAQITWTDVPSGTIVDDINGALLVGNWQ